MTKLVKFKATARGYYDDVIHDPELSRHVIFDAPEDWSASWAERVDGKPASKPAPVISADTIAAEAILEAEAEAGIPDLPQDVPGVETDHDADDIPSDVSESADVNEATGVEVL